MERDHAAIFRSMQMMHRYGFRIQTKSPARRFGDIRIIVTNRRLGINQTVEGRSYRLARLAAAELAEKAELASRNDVLVEAVTA
jgi:hypothetical protein